jgi:type II restriction/modification system DNA methylase subunit YeeA
MVGYDDGSEKARTLDDQLVQRVNADLTASVDLTQARCLRANSGLCFQGPVKVGPFDIDDSVAQRMLRQANPHGRSNGEVIKPWANASDLTRRPRGKWIIDFGELSLEEAALYEAPFEYVKREIRPLRERNRDKQRRTSWWRLGRSGSDLKSARAGLMRTIVTPRVSKHRVLLWASPEMLPDSAVVAITRDDDYFFGLLHSRAHELWARRKGTQLREATSGSRYTPTTTFETFPFPWPPGQESQDDLLVEAIAEAARELVEKRDAWPNPEGATEPELKRRTLTNLYNQRPTWLDMAHRKLDEAVLAAYGWPLDVDDEEILARLLALNLERAPA